MILPDSAFRDAIQSVMMFMIIGSVVWLFTSY